MANHDEERNDRGVLTLESVSYRVGDVSRRVRAIEAIKPDVLAYEVGQLADDVKALKRAFYTFAFSVALAAITFAFTVFALLGKHP